MELNEVFFVMFLENDEIDAISSNQQEGAQSTPFVASTSKKKDD